MTPAPSPARKGRRDRREAARIALIECAETLFAEGSIESVSLRQIGAAIGSANNGIVAYYFGTKESLVEAIYFHRIPLLEQRRAELLAKAQAEGWDRSIEGLMHVLCVPLLELTNKEGRHSYAGFLASMGRSEMADAWEALTSTYPVTQDVIGRIRQLAPTEAQPLFSIRLKIALGLITSVLSIIDQNTAKGSSDLAQNIFSDAMRMTAAAISAPVGN
jgi:AcrR family transcriptional regulator